MINAIETTYKGYRFRSRLEARWAVFFDALNLSWTYEKEGYELENGVRYLPDFWICLHPDLCPDKGDFIEIKAAAPSEKEREKLNLLAKSSGQNVACFWGNPWPEEWYSSIYFSGSGNCFVWAGLFNEDYMAIVGIPGNRPEYTPREDLAVCVLPFGLLWLSQPYPLQKIMIKEAFKAARGARFEFGERG